MVHGVGGRGTAAVPVGDLGHLGAEGVTDELGTDAKLDTGGVERAAGIEAVSMALFKSDENTAS